MAATPGPWSVFEAKRAIGGVHPGIEAGKRTIVLFGTDDDDGGVRGATPEEADANAKLIAAAPSLADALEALLGWQSLAPGDEIERARAALRLAGRL